MVVAPYLMYIPCMYVHVHTSSTYIYIYIRGTWLRTIVYVYLHIMYSCTTVIVASGYSSILYVSKSISAYKHSACSKEGYGKLLKNLRLKYTDFEQLFWGEFQYELCFVKYEMPVII